MKLEVNDNRIQFQDGSIAALHAVLDAREIDEKIIVIYDYMAFPKNEPARNMFAYDKSGYQLWRVEDIGMGATDAYTNILSESPFKVGNFAAFSVNIDLCSGKVNHKEFTK